MSIPDPALPCASPLGSLRSSTPLAVLAACLAATPLQPASAFPPAPFKTIHGMVRDEFGHALRVDGASVVFFQNGKEVLRSPIRPSSLPNQNYQFRLRMDMLRSGTANYSDLAQNPGRTFTLAIEVNSVLYHPIEMSTPPQVGKPGERTRINLTLGADANGDGLPDAWQQSQLYAADIMPDENGWRYDLLGRDGDFDGDGITNYAEYIAGTYATDGADFLALKIVEKQKTSVRLGFRSIIGKTYTLETSPDMKTWRTTPLYTANPEPADPPAGFTRPAAADRLEAASTANMEIFSDLQTAPQTFYRLIVR